MSTPAGIQVLPPGAGYGFVIGIGGLFAALMLGITYLQNRYTAYSTGQAEEFNTASRSVKPGLIAAGIVSSYTWSATLLTSSTFAYSYGIGGPMWYAAMGTFQILLIALVAVKIKATAPGAHTFPEIVLARHGRFAHATFLYHGLLTNVLVGACLVLGGSQIVGAMTGMDVYAACFLIPSVVFFSQALQFPAMLQRRQGLVRLMYRGRFAEYVYCGLYAHGHFVHRDFRLWLRGLYFQWTDWQVCVFQVSRGPLSHLADAGSPSEFYDLLVDASEKMPIAGNYNGSYLTFKSINGLVFAVDILVAGFSSVWLDQVWKILSFDTYF